MATDVRQLQVLEEVFAVVKLPPSAKMPSWLGNGELVSVTRTAEELSVICPRAMLPAENGSERPYRALRVEGPLDPSEVGVLLSLLAPLTEASVSILSLSTFLTDYIFVPEDELARAVTALRAAGHRVVER